MASSTKSAIIHVRVTPKIRDKVRSAAKRDRRSVSEWVALMLEKSVEEAT